jgi:hypothetical protein
MAGDGLHVYTEMEALALARYMYLLGREHEQEGRTIDVDMINAYAAGDLTAIRGGRRETESERRDGDGG